MRDVALIWEKSPQNITISQGTINYYAKNSDPDKYFDITKSLVLSIPDIAKGSRAVAQVITEELRQELVFSTEAWYAIDKSTNLWMTLKKPHYLVVGMIHKFLDYSVMMKNVEYYNNSTNNGETINNNE